MFTTMGVIKFVLCVYIYICVCVCVCVCEIDIEHHVIRPFVSKDLIQ